MSAAQGTQTPGERRVFFGWYLVGFTFAAQFAVTGTIYYSFGVLQKPLAEAFGASRFEVSLALSLQTLVMALISPSMGRWISNHPLRPLMLIGAGAYATGFLLASQAQSLLHLYLTYGVLLALGMGLLGHIPCGAMLANWFSRRRGAAFGISQLGVSLSGALMVPATSWLIEAEGWRTAASLYGLAFPALLLPAIWFLAIDRPEDRGLTPDGLPMSHFTPIADSDGVWTLRRALADRRIWLLVAVAGPSFMGIGAILLALYPHFTDLGLSALRASGIIAVATTMAALAKPLFGVLSDWMDKRLLMGVSCLCQMSGLTCLLMFETYPGMVTAGVLFGLGYGAVMPMQMMLISALFGREAFARVLGLSMPLTTPFTLAGLPFASWIFDETGSYQWAFVTILAALGVSLVAIALLRVPAEAR